MASAEAAAALPPADGQPSAEDDELYRSDAFRMQCMKVRGLGGPAGAGRAWPRRRDYWRLFLGLGAPARPLHSLSGSLQEPWGRARRT